MMGQMMDDKVAARVNNAYAEKTGTATVDWATVAAIFESIPRENLLTNILATILQSSSKVSTVLLAKYLNNESRENFIKSAIINLMSTPEYQLCSRSPL